MRAFGSNAAFAALFGPAHELQSVAGFTAYKCLGFLSIVGAVWGLLTATRLLRGEEEAGRFELLLAGPTTARRATTEALGGLGAGLATMFALTAALAALAGRSSKIDFSVTSALFFALALVASAGVFLGVGAVTAQLAPTRRQAAAYAGVVFGVCYALRMVADSGTGLEWMRWTTPLGWVEQLQPLTRSDAVALVPLAALVAGLNVVAPALCVLGLGALVLGLWPRAAGAAPFVLVGWSIFVDLVGGLAHMSHWLLDTSLFHQMAAAPAAAADWASAGAMAGVGVVAAVLGLVAFDRRDLQVR
ncbi:MAG TPA: hypothetical protein VMV14_10280 [Acidimicrobiales bacterium]|nr:hypothetical protein [Acidimicrobiales bacterium]